MDNQFFDRPILNSPYEYPERHWELDVQGQPTQRIIERRRRGVLDRFEFMDPRVLEATIDPPTQKLEKFVRIPDNEDGSLRYAAVLII